MILIKTERAFATWLIGIAANPVLRGQDDAEVTAPCLVVYCQAGEQLEFFTTTHRVEVQISLFFPADESPKHLELLEKFEFAAAQLVNALYIDDILAQVSQLEAGITLLHQMTKWVLESNWIGRNRLVRLRAQFHAVPEDPAAP
jgi:hypothetical protein